MVELRMRLDGLVLGVGTLHAQRTCTGIHIGVTNRDPSRSADARWLMTFVLKYIYPLYPQFHQSILGPTVG
jgi:hypothetical protein